MLAEISCDKFIDEGIPRGPVKLKPSLNVVLGSSDGSNSIGKSTFLLIVDFAFGGSAYARSATTIANVGPHRINFSFQFDGESYSFSRSPMDANLVWVCDANYAKASEITLKEFTSWLAGRYGLDKCGGTFRELTSNFMRVYGKDNYDVSKPLAANPHEQQAKGVTRLLRLFGEYGGIDEIQQKLTDAEQARKTYTDSLRREFIASAHGKKEAQQNSKKIAELQSQIAEMETMEHDNLSELDPIIADRVASLKSDLSRLRRRRTMLSSQRKMMEADAELGRFRKTKDFEKLLRFFPDANLKTLEEIEAFHEKLTRNLSEERRSQANRLEGEIEAVESEISAVEDAIRETGSTSSLTKAVLRRYSEISGQIQRLEEANASFEKKNSLAERVSDLKAQRDELIKSALSSAQSRMNDSLMQLNEFVCGTEANAPRLSLASSGSYSFGIPNDTGTGSQTRALALFDISLLRLTPLPAIALDTVSIKQVGDEPWLKILELYCANDKQVFITFDKAESYSGGKLPKTVEDNVVLELSRGHELFGRSWASKSVS